MFSGIIKATARVNSIVSAGTTQRITFESALSNSFSIDQSIAHDGICLTIVAVEGSQHSVDVVHETLSKTTFAHLREGDMVNIESAITPTTLLDGHLVQGHVDSTLRCIEKIDMNGSWKFRFELPAQFAQLVIPHGSICLNGVSLTIAQLYDDSFEVAIIPYTFENTNFQHLKPGGQVNVEFDLVGKYLQRQRK